MKLEQQFATDETIVYSGGVKGLASPHIPRRRVRLPARCTPQASQTQLGSKLNLAQAALYDRIAGNELLSGLYYSLRIARVRSRAPGDPVRTREVPA